MDDPAPRWRAVALAALGVGAPSLLVTVVVWPLAVSLVTPVSAGPALVSPGVQVGLSVFGAVALGLAALRRLVTWPAWALRVERLSIAVVAGVSGGAVGVLLAVRLSGAIGRLAEGVVAGEFWAALVKLFVLPWIPAVLTGVGFGACARRALPDARSTLALGGTFVACSIFYHGVTTILAFLVLFSSVRPFLPPAWVQSAALGLSVVLFLLAGGVAASRDPSKKV